VIADTAVHLVGWGFGRFSPFVTVLPRWAGASLSPRGDDTDPSGDVPPIRHTVAVNAPTPATAAAIVLAGGSGTRLGAGQNKVYLPLRGRPVLAWSLATFLGMPEVGVVVLVVREPDRPLAERVLAEHATGDVEVVVGGRTRQESELAGLRRLAARIEAGAVDAVLVHDAARPLATRELASSVLAAARADGGAVPGLRRDDVAAAAGDGSVLVGPPAERLVAVQTPQAFRAAPLLAAYEEAARCGFTGTDTAACVERFAPDVPIRWVRGDERNIKITYAHDLLVAEHAAPVRTV
jgi:2-C-methyl-D-erythritol 4-phosphate cytidylyltransferase